jgi:hypothetical protein
MQRTRWYRILAVLGVTTALVVSGLAVGGSSSHREAPLITEDPVADNTDTYAFVAPDAPDAVTLVGNWIPLEQPNGGPNFHKFGDDVLYAFEVDNDGDAYEDVSYLFRFTTKVANPDTFLYNTGQVTSIDDPDLNVRQYYSVTEVRDGVRSTLAAMVPVAPANVGPRSMPDYGAIATQAVRTITGGIKVFAGPRDDPFFVDLGSVFDLAGLRPLNGAHALPRGAEPGVDGVAGYNTHSIVLQVPTSRLVEDDPVIGVWSTTHRRQTTVLDHDGDRPHRVGRWVQVSRLGMPLVNEVVVPLGKKDRFNASEPAGDGQFASYVFDPEPSRLIPLLYPGVSVPPAPRTDLATIFLTGIPDLNRPDGVRGSEMIRLDTSTAPTPFAGQDRLGLLAGQPDGFPNGRRLIDDVTDIELRALAGGTPFTPAFNVFPNNALTDGVDANDVPFLASFPYLALPHSGYDTPALG